MLFKGVLKTIKPGLVTAALLVGASAQAAFISNQDIAAEKLRYQVVGGQQSEYSWWANYYIGYSAEDKTFNIELKIGLNGDDPGQALVDEWDQAIDAKWDNQFFVLEDNSNLYSVNLEADFFNFSTASTAERRAANHLVTFREGSGNVDLGNWYENPVNPFSQGQLAAHEIGHLLGNYDEYVSGGVNPDDPATWSVYDSLMGGGLTDTLYERHYDFVIDWANGVSGNDGSTEFVLISAAEAAALLPPAPVPLPAGLWLFVSALAALRLTSSLRR